MDSFLGVYTMGGGFWAENPRRAALRGENQVLQMPPPKDFQNSVRSENFTI